MRIISGQFKGKKIFEPKDKKTRPLKDLAKESLFNIINHSNKFNVKIMNSNVLDLFSGVGSFGIESLSRGAKHVTFIENYQSVLKVLKKNIESLELTEKCNIIEKNILNDRIFDKLYTNYDLIFLDPPFKEKEISKILNRIQKSNILKEGGVIILHRESKNKEKFSEKFKIIEEKKYGISKIIFGTYL